MAYGAVRAVANRLSAGGLDRVIIGKGLDMTRKQKLSHVGVDGHVRMVDVGIKRTTARYARAQAVVQLGPVITRALKKTGALAKGNVLETARIAGILAAKSTPSLIPMCHPLPLDSVAVALRWSGNSLRIEATVRCTARTGAEMEALVAASVAALTVYDMCKSADKGIVIRDICLLEKSGGKSGHWRRGSPRVEEGCSHGQD